MQEEVKYTICPKEKKSQMRRRALNLSEGIQVSLHWKTEQEKRI